MTTREHTVSGPGGRTLAVTDFGDPDGVPVLTHHGTPGSGSFYESWRADATARGIRLIAYDRAGYGGSDRLEVTSIADVAPDVEAICDQLGLDRILTHGRSGGGPHALACAALLPDRVAAAGTQCSIAPFDAGGLDFLDGMGDANVVELGAAIAGEQELAPL